MIFLIIRYKGPAGVDCPGGFPSVTFEFSTENAAYAKVRELMAGPVFWEDISIIRGGRVARWETGALYLQKIREASANA